MAKLNTLFLLVLTLVFGTCLTAKAQSLAEPRPQMNAAEIKLALKKLQVTGTAMYLAAHPDDENTRLIAYLAKGRLYRTAYLALTRGDGGQNLIGTEVRELLGVIRTQELLAARRTDGGQQFFTRANDFGYSKNTEETQQIWDKEKVKADMVWVIRKFQPDVIITRFSHNEFTKRNHGHHVTSAVFGAEISKLAADPTKYPEQLKYVKVWKPKRVVWNTYRHYMRFTGAKTKPDMSKYPKVDAGTYNVLLGKGYGEIAAESRSMHRSQGFGSAKRRGVQYEYFEHVDGDKVSGGQADLFEGIDVTWKRVKGGKKLIPILAKAYKEFDVQNPAKIIPTLTKAYKLMQKLPQSALVQAKLEELKNVIFQCAGVWYEALSPVYGVAAGDKVQLNVQIIKRSDYPVTLQKIDAVSAENNVSKVLKDNRLERIKLSVTIPANAQNSQPYWLHERADKGMFKVKEQILIGLPENKPAIPVKFTFKVGDLMLTDMAPVFHKWVIPQRGERYRALEITPPVTANIVNPVYLFTSQAQSIEVVVKAHTHNFVGKVALQLPKGWKSSPTSAEVNLKEKYQEQKISFKVTPPAQASEGVAKAIVTAGGKVYTYGLLTIDYPHIPIQTIFPVAKAKIAKLKIAKKGELIGYIMGAGDKVPESLRQIGYKVDLLKDADITAANLKKYDAVMVGIRAYNTKKRMKFHQKTLLDYVKSGGNMVVQYNTSRRTVTKQLGPYPLKLSRDRVTVEEAKMSFVAPKHPVLNTPNKLTAADFDHWVQERGLYFPNQWDEKYQPIFSCNDPGESPKKGSLLIAKYGKGYYAYTGLSFFRELPAGVAGAYRLLANILSLGK
ncbi:PIG-L family deacetylase [Microscilla marina]|uniref:LmbE family protein n=1 Tax=Microscilla marina ATCC 23134 TaxID=313606 RepID=A1ZF64_MICM2|nr:PIG-L family deacetylase [Microscilla marina]EAY31166.1 conserved hypothetical protein [Microscilla marina ATCC 23134]